MRGQLECVRRGRARLFFVCVKGRAVFVCGACACPVARRVACASRRPSRLARLSRVSSSPRHTWPARRIQRRFPEAEGPRRRRSGQRGARAPQLRHRDAVAFCALAGCDRKGLMRAYLCDFLKYFTRAAATAHRHQTQHGRDRHESCRSRAPRVVKPAELVPYQGRSGRTTVPTSNDTYMRLECASFVGIKSVGSTGISTYAAHANAKPPSELWHDTDLS